MKTVRTLLLLFIAQLLLQSTLAAQPKVLTPGKLKITELDPADDLNGKMFAPPLENNQGMIQITLEPAVLKYFSNEDVQRWFRESRITIDQLTFDRNSVTARRDGDVTLRFTYSFLPGQNEVSRRVQIRREATGGVFGSYFLSHRFYNQRVSRLVIGISEEPVLEQEAKGSLTVNTGSVTDVEIEAIGADGLPRKFFINTFDLPVGSFTIVVSKAGFETARKSVVVKAGDAQTIDFTLKATATRVAPPAAPNEQVLKFREAALNRLKVARTFTARRSVLGGRFNPDGNLLVTWNADNLIYVWDVEKGQPSQVLAGHTSEILDVQFYPAQHVLFSYSENLIVLYDLKTGKPSHSVAARDIQRSGIKAATFVPEQQSIIVAGKDQTQKVWNIPTRRESGALEATSPNKFIAVPDQKLYISLQADGLVKMRTGLTSTTATVEAEGNLANGFVTPDNRFLVVGSEDVVFINNTVTVAAINGTSIVRTATLKASAPVALYRNQFLIAADNNARNLTLYDIGTGEALLSATSISAGEKMAAISPDGRYFATNGSGNDVILYDLSLLEEWRFLMEISGRHSAYTRNFENLAFVRQRLKKPVQLFKDAATMRTYDEKIVAGFDPISGEAFSVVQNLRNAQTDFVKTLRSLSDTLLPQQAVETRADYEKRMNAGLSRVSSAREQYLQFEENARIELDRDLLKGIVFEIINESSGLPVRFGTYDKDLQVQPVTIGPLSSFVSLDEKAATAFVKEAANPKVWQVMQSDVTVDPVIHRLAAVLPGRTEPVYLGDESLSFPLKPEALYTNLFTIGIKASGFVTFNLTDKASTIDALATKDGNSFTKTLSSKTQALEFRPGTYDLRITSKKNKTIERWTVRVDPGSNQVLALQQFGPKAQTAVLVFNGKETPYQVNVTGANNKTTSYKIWSATQALEVPKGKYILTYSKPGFNVAARSNVTVTAGMREEINLEFAATGAPMPKAPVDPVAMQTPPVVSEQKLPEPQPEIRKKKGSGRLLLFLAAAGGGGYFLYSELNKGGASPLPAPPARPN
jgi:hypothetical protein